MNRKPHNNKPDYDPGRFRAVLDLYIGTAVTKPSGGSTYSEDFYTQVKAVEISLREYDQFVATMGLSLLEEGRYFVIRKSKDFTPDKNYVIKCFGKEYVIHAVIPLGSPVKYYKILAQHRHVE